MVSADDVRAYRTETGARLKELRLKRGLDQKQLAELARKHTTKKLAQGTASQIELGNRGMPPYQREAFGRALNVDPAWLDPLLTPKFDLELAVAGVAAPKGPHVPQAGDLNRVSVLLDKLARTSPSLRRYVERFKVPDEVIVGLATKKYRSRGPAPVDEDNDAYWDEAVTSIREQLGGKYALPGAPGEASRRAPRKK